MPAHAGIQVDWEDWVATAHKDWIPAFAGKTESGEMRAGAGPQASV